MIYAALIAAIVVGAAFAVPPRAAAAGGDLVYKDIISSNAVCRAFFWQGIEAMGNENLEEGKGYLQGAAGADGACFLAYLLMSQIEYVAGNDKEATEYLQKIPPEPPELAGLYEDVAAALRADNYERVVTFATDLIAAYPQTITAIAALHLLARAQYYTGARDEARRTFKEAYLYSGLAPGTVPAYGSDAEATALETFAGVR